MHRQCETVVCLLDRPQLHPLLDDGPHTVSLSPVCVCKETDRAQEPWFLFWGLLQDLGGGAGSRVKSICVQWFVVYRQLVTNYRTGKADQVLSVWFLMQWVIGDTTNLLGAILTDQLFTQVSQSYNNSALYINHSDCYGCVLCADRLCLCITIHLLYYQEPRTQRCCL